MAFKQEVNVPLLFTIGIISGIMILVVVIGVQAWFQSEELTEMAIKANDAQARALNSLTPDLSFPELKLQQLTALESQPHWVDATKKDRAAIPIEQAMDYLVNHQGNLPQ